jgi:hypothetical protein
MKDPRKIFIPFEFEILKAIIADHGMDTQWLFEVVEDYFSANVSFAQFDAMLSGKKFIRPELKIRIWFEVRKFAPDRYLNVIDFFIEGNLIRMKNAVLHPNRRKPKHHIFDRLKKSEYSFLVEDDPIQNQSWPSQLKKIEGSDE